MDQFRLDLVVGNHVKESLQNKIMECLYIDFSKLISDGVTINSFVK